MTDKSYVSLETNICVVCGKECDTGALLLDKRLRDNMERKTCTGIGLCEEHEKLHNNGYIALVEADISRSITDSEGKSKPNDWYRLGRIMHIRREVFQQMFDTPNLVSEVALPASPEVFDTLENMLNGGK